MRKPRVLLAEDNPGLREALERQLDLRFDVIGSVADGQALVEEAKRLEPDIIVSDITMPRMSGFEAARVLVGCLPHTRIVFLSSHTDPAYVREALGIGAMGYVLKSSASELEEALRQISKGERYLSKKLRNRL